MFNGPANLWNFGRDHEFLREGGGVGEERSVIRILQSHRGRSAECYRKTKKIFLPPLPQKGKVMPSTLYST